MDQSIWVLVAEMGFPIASAVGVAAAIWAIVKWMMNNLHREVQDIQSKLDSTQREQYEILVKLIDRVRSLEDSVTRTEIVVRTAHNLEQQWDRVGRSKE